MKGVTTDHTGLGRYQLSFYVALAIEAITVISRAGLGYSSVDREFCARLNPCSPPISPRLPCPLRKRLLRSAPLPPLLCTDTSHPLPHRGITLPQTAQVSRANNYSPSCYSESKRLIKIPLVAKPWVRSDFVSEISEPDWPKQPTCLNGNGTSERPAFLFTPRLNKPPKSPQCERGQRKHPAGTPSPARHMEGAGV